MSDSEKDLAGRALRGDRAAFEQLYRACGRRIRAYFLRSGFGQADADDLLQETFLRAYRALGGFDPQRGAFGAWAGTIARNLARKRWARRRDPEHFDADLAEQTLHAPANPGESPEAREESEALGECLSRLDEPLGRIIRLRYVSAMTTRGIAAETGLAEATVRLRLREAQDRLEACLRRKGILE